MKITRLTLILLVAIFLIIFASRIWRLNGMNLQRDEVWSVWQTLGTLQQTIEWTPYDWSPAYYLTVFGWRNAVGISPFALRVLTVLTMLITAALLFRLAHRLVGERAAVIATLAFSGLGYVLFLSTVLRAYTLTLALFIVAVLLTMRYFERRSRATAIWLALVITALFYIHVTAIFAILLLVLFSVVMYRMKPMQWLRLWALPGLITFVLCLPEAINKLATIPIKARIVDLYIPYQPETTRLAKHYVDYAGAQPVLWGSLLLVASAMLLERWKFQRKAVALIVWMLMPVVVLILGSRVDAFNPRHIPWVMVGFAVWIGWGLSLLPRPALVALALVITGCSFDSIPINERYETIERVPLVTTFDQLKHVYRDGDVFLIDPVCKGCNPPEKEEWDYFGRAYFPYGITFVMSPTGYRRVWYIAYEGQEDPATFDTLIRQRAHSYTVGDKKLLFRLYEAPPDPTGVVFENGMRFNGVEFLNTARQSLVWKEGDTLIVRLWWSVAGPITFDYAEGTYMLDDKRGVVAEFNGAPQILNGPTETSRWLPERYYLEERLITLPNPLETGDKQVLLSVYDWRTVTKIKAPGLTADDLLILGRIYVKSL